MDDLPIYLYHQGTNFKSYEFLGSHLTTLNGKNGAVFRVWAPNAKYVSLVGDFNEWDDKATPMNKIDDEGVYEVFVEGLKNYDAYKYAVTSKKGVTVLKADPFAFHSETTPATASKIYDLSGYKWSDREYFKNIIGKNYLRSAMNIYEVNLLSWKKNSDGSYYTYRQLADELVDYVLDSGYNYVEFMPITEYPFDGSWGYQVTGYFSVTSRLGTPKDFMYLVDSFHKKGVGVILDWVPAHFPKDLHGLYEFDGEPLYECHGLDRQEHKAWGTRIFDYGRTEIQSFLISSATFFFDVYHIDGLRVDAVASMLYLDYDRKAGEWTPNVYGDNKNLDAIAFFHKLNKAIFENYPYALMIAEESTANVKITGQIEDGALGFNFKWNMGWMNDILSYMKVDPLFRRYDHNKLTFSMMYAFSENFVLPISHDEVVHGKCSLLNKMPGEYEDKFANNRAFVGYMMGHPGKKLTFMGEEFGQFKEWNYEEGLEFFMKDYPMHGKLYEFYKDINKFYLNNDALYSFDYGWEGFKWLDADNRDNNVIAFMRIGKSGQKLVCIISFNGANLENYTLSIEEGKYKVVFDSNKEKYGGNGHSRKRIYTAKTNVKEKDKYFISLDVPKLSFIYLEKII